MAVARRTSDVLSWLAVPSAAFCPPIIIGVGDPPQVDVPSRTELFRVTPNPFNPSTSVRYQLARDAWVTLRVYDIGGRAVRTLLDESRKAGPHTTTWDGMTDTGTAAGTGVYWVRMSTSRGFQATTKIVLLQ